MFFPIGLCGKFALRPAVLALALAAAPAVAQSQWSKATAVLVQPDDSWGPKSQDKRGARLAIDKAFNLFVNLKDSLWIGADNGQSWRVERRKSNPQLWNKSAMGLGWDGTLLWDNGTSHDQGRSWRLFGDSTKRALFVSAYGVLGNGALLAGGSYDLLEMSLDTGRTWARVHFGRTFGRITAIVSGEKGDRWAFAAPEYDDLMATRDQGKTWVTATSLITGNPPQRIVAKFMACDPAEHLLMAVTVPTSGSPGFEELRWAGDSLLSVSRPVTHSFPDSQVSAFAMHQGSVYLPRILWLGTWGQGVWVSSDWGETWSPRNEGLTDLHVEALVVAADGTAHALTRDGLYSRATPTTLARNPAPRARATRTAPGRGNGILFISGGRVSNGLNLSENLFGADGRALRLIPSERRPAVGAP